MMMVDCLTQVNKLINIGGKIMKKKHSTFLRFRNIVMQSYIIFVHRGKFSKKFIHIYI